MLVMLLAAATAAAAQCKSHSTYNRGHTLVVVELIDHTQQRFCTH
jgi:hypothetical protein